MVYSTGHAIGINCALGGAMFAFSCFCVLTTPFLNELKCPPWMTSLIMAIGPVVGFFVQPITGSISDRSHNRMGRRRPFIIGSSFAVALF